MSLSDLGSATLEWWQLPGLIEHLPRDSATVRELLGEAADWTIDTHLLAYMADGVWVGNWQRSAGKKKDYPEPVKRPGAEKPKSADETFKSKPRTFAEIDAILASVQVDGGDDVSLDP